MKEDRGCCRCHAEIQPHEATYLTKDEVWDQTGYPRKTKDYYVVLCMRCLETLLGRPLIREDFVTTPEEGYARYRQWVLQNKQHWGLT